MHTHTHPQTDTRALGYRRAGVVRGFFPAVITKHSAQHLMAVWGRGGKGRGMLGGALSGSSGEIDEPITAIKLGV